jgi:hypothetical protein
MKRTVKKICDIAKARWRSPNDVSCNRETLVRLINADACFVYLEDDRHKVYVHINDDLPDGAFLLEDDIGSGREMWVEEEKE